MSQDGRLWLPSAPACGLRASFQGAWSSTVSLVTGRQLEVHCLDSALACLSPPSPAGQLQTEEQSQACSPPHPGTAPQPQLLHTQEVHAHMHACPVGLHVDPHASKPVCTDMSIGHPQTPMCSYVHLCMPIHMYIHTCRARHILMEPHVQTQMYAWQLTWPASASVSGAWTTNGGLGPAGSVYECPESEHVEHRNRPPAWTCTYLCLVQG